jgi:hypothetical protein
VPVTLEAWRRVLGFWVRMVVEMRTRFSFTPTALEQNVAPPMMAVADTAIGCPKASPKKRRAIAAGQAIVTGRLAAPMKSKDNIT